MYQLADTHQTLTVSSTFTSSPLECLSPSCLTPSLKLSPPQGKHNTPPWHWPSITRALYFPWDDYLGPQRAEWVRLVRALCFCHARQNPLKAYAIEWLLSVLRLHAFCSRVVCWSFCVYIHHLPSRFIISHLRCDVPASWHMMQDW